MAPFYVILVLIHLYPIAEGALEMTDIYQWPGGFQSSFTVRANQRLGGWKAHLLFDAPVKSLQVWKGTVYSMINSGREFIIQNKSTDGIIVPGEDLVVEVQGYTAVTDTPHGIYFIEGYNGTIIPKPTAAPDGSTTRYDYREALRLSILFYDAQRSGKMPPNNPIPWRGDSHVNDSDNGHDLSGGWYDAGDQNKFAFPLANAVTLLEWGFLRFYDGYEAAGQVQPMCDMIRWPLEWMLKAWLPDTKTLYVQVGDPKFEWNYWGRPEDSTIPRPAFFVNTTCPGSDVSAAMASALAAGAILFNQTCTDKDFSSRLRDAAISLYDFAENYRGLYSNCLVGKTEIPYKSSDDRDELANAAAWLYKMTNKGSYLTDAKSYHQNGIPWALSWDNQTPETDLLLYEITKEIRYRSEVESYVIGWMPGGQVTQTPCGLAYRDKWGALRYSDLPRFKGVPNDITNSCPNTVNNCDPNHHNANYNLLKGGLVGGPDAHDTYQDNRQDYVKNEVAIDYNAGFQGALAGLSYFAMKNGLPESPDSLC